jgi:hypothetical protein
MGQNGHCAPTIPLGSPQLVMPFELLAQFGDLHHWRALDVR